MKQYVRLLPVERSPIAVHLVLADEDESDAKGHFARIGRQDPECRTYLAEVLTATGASIVRAVLQLPEISADPSDISGESALTNAELEERWQLAREDLGAFQGAQRYFPELLLPGDDGVVMIGPTAYCPVPKVMFSYPCPTCFGPLRTCRDDAVLASEGLPLYSPTRTRLLHCPTCSEVQDEHRFYTVVPDPETSDLDNVSGPEVLVSALAEAIDRVRREEATVAPGTTLPCTSCAVAGPCLGVQEAAGGSARGRETSDGSKPSPSWQPFVPFDSPFLLSRLAPTSIEDFLKALGGGVLEGSEESLTPATGFLFAEDGSGLDAVEVLTLKLTLFLQIVRAVREYYRLLGIPHLDLSPRKVAVELAPTGDSLPGYWQFQVKLLGTSSSRVRTLTEGIQVMEPSEKPKAPYFSPAIRDFLLIAPRASELIVDRMLEEPGLVGQWRIEGRLADPHGIFPKPNSEDWIHLSWAQDIYGLGVRSAAARVDPRVSKVRATGELAVTSEPLAMEADAVERLSRVGGVRFSDVRYKVYPNFGVRDDLYSLGMMLFSILLVNDRSDLSSVDEILAASLRHTHVQGAASDMQAASSLEDVVQLAFKDFPERLAKANIFYQEVDRSTDRPNSAPDELWRQILTIAFRMVHGGESEVGKSDTTLALDLFLDEIEALLRKLQGILFSRQTSNLEIQSVIAELLSEEMHRK